MRVQTCCRGELPFFIGREGEIGLAHVGEYLFDFGIFEGMPGFELLPMKTGQEFGTRLLLVPFDVDPNKDSAGGQDLFQPADRGCQLFQRIVVERVAGQDQVGRWVEAFLERGCQVGMPEFDWTIEMRKPGSRSIECCLREIDPHVAGHGHSPQAFATHAAIAAT